jgi:hypothetical protein
MIFSDGPVAGREPMKRVTILAVALAFALAAAPRPASAQFQPEEIAQREAQEEFLRTAEIVRSEPIGEGVTKPWKLYLKKGDVEGKAAWKNPHGEMGGYLEGWQYEIAAYRLDKLIGLNMVPTAVERKFNGTPGALVLWAENRGSLLDIIENKVRIPDEALEHTEKMKWLTRAWDCLIANEDRTQQLPLPDWQVIVFDHSGPSGRGEFVKRLMFGRDRIKKSSGAPWLFRRLPRWFVEKVRGLTFESIKAAVGGTLKDREIKAILARRELLLEEIAGMIKEQGEAAVIY